MIIEKHPIHPFFPSGAKWLFLGSFPPKQHRWSMDFFYPNFNNDMWRIFGLIFFNDKNHFVDNEKKRFKKELITEFLMKQRIAMYDIAAAVIRRKDNASDQDLEIVETADIEKIIAALPELQNIVTTGGKASDAIIQYFAEKNISINNPKIGSHTSFIFAERTLRIYRMPSSSRAYPLAADKKADIYRKMFDVL